MAALREKIGIKTKDAREGRPCETVMFFATYDVVLSADHSLGCT